MIVREIFRHPELTEELIKAFDYFNDTQDTVMYLHAMEREAKTPEEAERARSIRLRLEEGEKLFIQEWAKRK